MLNKTKIITPELAGAKPIRYLSVGIGAPHEVEDEIVDGDRVAIRFTSRGTNMGDFMGNPPTGNRVEISEVAIFKLLNGKVSEQWVYPDILSLQRQLKVKQQR